MPPHRPLADRFAEKTRPDPSSGCIVWTATRDRCGYGRIRVGNGHEGAHRVAWVLEHGEIPGGLHVLHRCDNPPCVNVAHLYLGTHSDNMRDLQERGPPTRNCGSENGRAKLTEAEAREIRATPRNAPGFGEPKHPTITELAERYGVSTTVIVQIRNGERWKEQHASRSRMATPSGSIQ